MYTSIDLYVCTFGTIICIHNHQQYHNMNLVHVAVSVRMFLACACVGEMIGWCIQV